MTSPYEQNMTLTSGKQVILPGEPCPLEQPSQDSREGENTTGLSTGQPNDGADEQRDENIVRVYGKPVIEKHEKSEKERELYPYKHCASDSDPLPEGSPRKNLIAHLQLFRYYSLNMLNA